MRKTCRRPEVGIQAGGGGGFLGGGSQMSAQPGIALPLPLGEQSWGPVSVQLCVPPPLERPQGGRVLLPADLPHDGLPPDNPPPPGPGLTCAGSGLAAPELLAVAGATGAHRQLLWAAPGPPLRPRLRDHRQRADGRRRPKAERGSPARRRPPPEHSRAEQPRLPARHLGFGAGPARGCSEGAQPRPSGAPGRRRGEPPLPPGGKGRLSRLRRAEAAPPAPAGHFAPLPGRPASVLA